uniref:Protein kinase domain-containing protein n=1 Tax=Ascaris lumbricoides TaxID=6252 RepID=A0A9J2Q619_ASCLU
MEFEKKCVHYSDFVTYLESDMSEFVLPCKYRMGKMLHYTSRTTVREGIRRSDKSTVAIIKLSGVTFSVERARHVYKELILLKKLHHPNVANLIEMYSPQNSAESLNEIYVVLDRNGYTLSYLIYINFKLSLPNLSFVFYQLLAAVNYLHSQRIILMNISTETVHLETNDHLKLCDYESLMGAKCTFDDCPATLQIEACKTVDMQSIGFVISEVVLGRKVDDLSPSTAREYFGDDNFGAIDDRFPELTQIFTASNAYDLICMSLRDYQSESPVSFCDAVQHSFVARWYREDEWNATFNNCEYNWHYDIHEQSTWKSKISLHYCTLLKKYKHNRSL